MAIKISDFYGWYPRIEMAYQDGITLFMQYNFTTDEATYIVRDCMHNELEHKYLGTAVKMFNELIEERKI